MKFLGCQTEESLARPMWFLFFFKVFFLVCISLVSVWSGQFSCSFLLLSIQDTTVSFFLDLFWKLFLDSITDSCQFLKLLLDFFSDPVWWEFINYGQGWSMWPLSAPIWYVLLMFFPLLERPISTRRSCQSIWRSFLDVHLCIPPTQLKLDFPLCLNIECPLPWPPM